MSGSFLLDTNIVISLFAGDRSVMTRLRRADEVFIPSIVIGELNYGARKSSRVKENIERIDRFVEIVTVLACDGRTAHFYGEIKDRLRLKGKPIPENDIWIAALAVQHNLTLVSQDDHFNEIDGLKKEVW